MKGTEALFSFRCTHGPDAVCNICVGEVQERIVAFNKGKGMLGGKPPVWLGRPYTLGNVVLWPLTCLFWATPGLSRLGNGIADLRFRLYTRFGWEWV